MLTLEKSIEERFGPASLSRRTVLNGTAAALVSAVLPTSAALTQEAAKFRRRNVSDPDASRDIDSYKKAIRAMLGLPPSDPRNWYRNALLHTLDCPHGNWWFLVWHRAFVGWFEQICRELSGDPKFALPYWDWTGEPRVPAIMFEDVLTPNDPAFIASFKEFKARFETTLATYWNGLSNDQINQLLNRGLRFPADLWFDIIDDPRGPMFFEPPIARGLTKEKPDLDVSPDTARAVSLPTLLNALAPRDFLTFGSAKTFFHSGLTGFGVLEGSPHNLVHNCVGGAYNQPPTGGFMQANLSPVDPLFFLHHCNIDRLWDVWTRKQQGFKSGAFPQGLPTLPEGADLAAWQREPFLFFVDSQGVKVAKTRAGDYATIGDFEYDYQPASGEEVVPIAISVVTIQRFETQVTRASVGPAQPAIASVMLSPALSEVVGPSTSNLFAKITLVLTPAVHAGIFRVEIDAPMTGPSGPQQAGAFAMFGHHFTPGPVTFTVPLSAPIAALRKSKQLAPSAPLEIRIIGEAMAHEAGELLSIVLEAH